MGRSDEKIQSDFINVAQLLLDNMPEGAERIVVTARGNYRVFGGSTEGFDANEASVEARIHRPLDPVRVLRDAMYEPGTGTWYRATFTVTRAGDADAEYDYDGEPENTDIIDPTEWVFELRKYPRDAAHIPDWLRKNLDISYQAFPQLLDEDIAANRPWLTDADRRR